MLIILQKTLSNILNKCYRITLLLVHIAYCTLSMSHVATYIVTWALELDNVGLSCPEEEGEV